ncbi:class I SAM-dependent methyltransferase [Actinocrispum wychmicini]|uniref:Methyltransferase family protein n=1 Tax=Actinocrispum wychmicini TaxID=1213861 RepID=A0A4R2J3C0_9PSEU|nr:class I SAM-dependent methyltransferase [Actinocrispum wychmicini]TCO52444.1 methyltransferase family protein [Actinocrispum wychmicini]
MSAQPGLVFGVNAANYDVHRPAIPAELAEWLIPPNCGLAVEMGSGTGHFTRILVDRAARVVATDPDPGMRAWLAEQLPTATVMEGTAEALPVETGTADGVFASSAWHWFDPRAAGTEAARCLKPGGVLGVCWYDRGQSDLWLPELQRMVMSAHRTDRPVHQFHLPEDLPFGPVEKRVVTAARQMTPEEICGLFTTYSAVITLPDEERKSLIGRFLVHLRARAVENGTETLEVPFFATLYRASRTG